MSDPTIDKRRLEENWRSGRFTNFQLPLPQYTQEGHLDCIYTIQFVGKWLVSGSRDTTLRIWDLVIKRLRDEPLRGHEASVLCLQFDPSDKEDIIISGSVDASFIIWRFSTGEKIRQVRNAHSESILSLQFDERYLVTGSKDGLIRVWNRQQLAATDEDYYPSVSDGPGATFPTYIVDTNTIPPPLLESQVANQQIQTLDPYTLLMILEGHSTAVNAVKLSKDRIVSGSGDGLIKIWNPRSGSCEMSVMGHTRGVACLQVDSQRIASGSSDDSVRIFNSTTGAEIACLQGHSNLVRTVQAGFRPFPGPEDDGGINWNQIVSGSYDGTIIVWRKDRDEKWVVCQRLLQEDASRAAAGVPNPKPENPQKATQVALHDPFPEANVFQPQESATRPIHEQPKVFKLQFDAQKIICCSQEPKILGWNFACHEDIVPA